MLLFRERSTAWPRPSPTGRWWRRSPEGSWTVCTAPKCEIQTAITWTVKTTEVGAVLPRLSTQGNTNPPPISAPPPLLPRELQVNRTRVALWCTLMWNSCHWSTNLDREITVSKRVMAFWFSVLFIFISTSACATCICVLHLSNISDRSLTRSPPGPLKACGAAL